jgi:ribosomal protein S2
MKIYKPSIKKTNFLKLKLFKNHIYLNKTNEILPRLKKALNVIFKYHTSNKRILFTGNPNKKLINTLTNTKHIFVPQSIWIEGILTNSESFFKKSIRKSKHISSQKFNMYGQLNKTIDLIVILNEPFVTKIVEEALKAQIPTVVYNCELNIFDSKPSFKIPNNNQKLTNNFFNAVLIAILQKTLKLKLKKPLNNYNLLSAKYFKNIKKLF